MTPLEKFTPGPWTIGPAEPSMKSLGKIVTIEIGGQNSITWNCQVLADEHGQANADLIMAATDMYRELFRALAVITNPQAFDIEGVRSDIANVLHKARGEK